ncbi:MAG: hypothetical protein Q9163_001609 [Psora crenata]
MSIITSPLMNKGYFRFCFNGGSLLLLASVLITSYCTKRWHLLPVQGVMTGIGMGLIFGSGVVVLMSYFFVHLGLATGVASCGGALGKPGMLYDPAARMFICAGGMIFPAVAERLVPKIGFPWTVRVICLIVFCTLFPANIITRERATRKRKGPPLMDWTLFYDIPFLLMTAGLFFAFWGIYIGFYYIVIYAQTNLHISSHTAISLLITLNAANLPGRLLPPLLSDCCLGPLNTLIPCTLLASFFLYVWIGSTSLVGFTMTLCAYGFAAGGVQSLYNAAVWEMSKLKHRRDGPRPVYGRTETDDSFLKVRLAVVLSAIGIATLTGAPLGGLLITRMDGGYLGAQLFAASSVLLGGVLLAGARWKKVGWKAAHV